MHIGGFRLLSVVLQVIHISANKCTNQGVQVRYVEQWVEHTWLRQGKAAAF